MKELGRLFADTTEFRKLVAENPELPIVFLVDSDVVADGDYSSWYCSDVKCYKSVILDCDQSINDEKIYTDESDFEEDLEEYIWNNFEDYSPTCHKCWGKSRLECEECGFEPTDVEVGEILKKELGKYEPFWKECIIVHGMN